MGLPPIKPMRFDIALVCAGALALGFSCSSGRCSSRREQWNFLSLWLNTEAVACRATKPNYQFFRAGAVGRRVPADRNTRAMASAWSAEQGYGLNTFNQYSWCEGDSAICVFKFQYNVTISLFKMQKLGLKL